MHPHRPRLSHLVAAEIREGIAQGRWKEWLPQERVLADELCASRSVVRQALATLKKERLIESLQSRGTRIIKKAKRAPASAEKIRTVVLVTPGSIEEMRPLVTLRLDEFRQQLIKENCQIQIIESKSAYLKNPEKALEALRAHYSADCWILRLSTKPMQKWFQKQGIPTVVLGTCHEEVALPYVGIDRRALSHHAVGVMISAGHYNFVHLISKESRGGDLESERGFLEAVAEARKHHPQLDAEIVHHDESVEGVISQVGKLLGRPKRPTALLIAQPTYYLTVAFDLARRGIQVPRDISLLSQSAGTYLSYVLPRPAYYQVDSFKFARRLLSVVLAVMAGGPSAPLYNNILPNYISGASLRTLAREEKSP